MIIMAKCPNCKNETPKPAKTWKYGIFTVQAYTCNNCKTQYREYYDKNGKLSFTLKLQKGKGYRKA
jgi:transposase-like protein